MNKFLVAFLVVALVILTVGTWSFPPTAQAAASFVKSASNSAFNRTVGVAFAGSVTANNVVAVMVGWLPATQTLTSITDTCGTVYTLVDNPVTGTSGRAAMAYGKISTTGSCTVTATGSTGVTYITATVHEISGVDTSIFLDNNQHKLSYQVTPSTAANAVTSGSITTTQNGDYIFGATFNESANGGLTITAGTGFTSRQASPYARSQDMIQATAGSIAATFTNNLGYANFITGIMAFKSAGGAPPPPDTIAPTVSISAPANNALLAGTATTISALASDNVAVLGVQFLLDGANFGAEDTTSPYSTTWNTTTASNGAHVLSARARDAAGNTALASNINVTVDNQAPSGTILINGGASATNSLSATLTLSATDLFSPVTQMRFSNTGSSFSTAENFATTKAWTLATGTGTKIVYAQFKDAAGNWSASVTDTIAWDTTAPTISGVIASNQTGNSATVGWTTNEPATSQVEYGLTTSYGTLTPIDNALLTSHSVNLTGLLPGTTYNYRVRSKDAAGNERIDTNNTFATLAQIDLIPPSVPDNLAAAAVSASQINLTWSASTDNVAVVGYDVFRNGVQISSPTSNSFQDTNLTPTTNYIYTVLARDAAGNLSGISVESFATTLPMTISNVSSSSITSSGATITWATDAAADSQVEYGTDTAYGQLTSLNTALVTNHSQALANLEADTLYHYRVKSKDSNGNPVDSLDFVFNTLPVGAGITLDLHGSKDNGAVSSSTVVVGPIGTPTAGDLIVCEFVFSSASVFANISDNVNSGNYLSAAAIHTNFNTNLRNGIYYKENVAAGNTTITLSYSPASARGAMSCQAWSGARASFALDSSFVQAQQGSGINPNTGSNLTPFGDGRVVIGAVAMNTQTPTAGVNYTLIDPNTTTKLFPEYWIQSSKTATAGNFNAASDSWYNQMAAFAPSSLGYCDSAVILDWNGGIDGATIGLTDLEASTKGGRKQPLSDTHAGNWQLNGPATGMTYSATAYRPFARSLDCPAYSGSGTGTVGVKYSTTQAAHSAQYNFETSSPAVSAATCFSTDLPNNDLGGPNDVFTLYGNTGVGSMDFDNVVVWGSGASLMIYMESGTASTGPNIPILSGHDYWIYLKYVKNGTHVLKVYDGCGANPTLLGTITHAAAANTSLSNYLIVGNAGALTSTQGKNYYYGAVKLDYMYGGDLLP